MAIKHILVPYDGSKQADHAFDTALDLALKNEAELYVVTWVPFHSFVVGYTLLTEHEIQQKVKKLVDKATKVNIKFKARILRYGASEQWSSWLDSVSELIVSYAKKNSIDLIVIGSRGLTGFKKKLVGSISEEVSRSASCQVLVVK